MKKILFAVVSVFSMAALASGTKAPAKFVCTYKVPNVHSMQDDGPYVGKGETPTDAKLNAIKACHEDLDYWTRDFPKDPCDEFAADTSRMECTINVK